MQAVAGEVLGPRPGIAICSFWQGRVEIFLRIVAPLVRKFNAACMHVSQDIANRIITVIIYEHTISY